MSEMDFFKKILLPVDDSVPALAAQELAAVIGKKYGSEVTALYVVSHPFVVPPVSGSSMVGEEAGQEYAPSQTARQGDHSFPKLFGPPDQARPIPEDVIGEISDWYHERGQAIVGEAVKLLKADDVKVDERVIENQDPAAAIIRQVEHEDYDSILIGRSGEKAKKPHLGSTAERVVRHAKVPVMVVAESRRMSKFLVPVDGSWASNKALNMAVDLAKELGAKITLLHVQEGGISRVKPELAKQLGDAILAQASSMIKDVEFDKRNESGSPGTVITDIAEKENSDLIVMGDKGHSSVRRFLLGSVSNHVLHYSDRAILIVK
jgi:nucleotide-binding universal stress UspA family protein